MHRRPLNTRVQAARALPGYQPFGRELGAQACAESLSGGGLAMGGSVVLWPDIDTRPAGAWMEREPGVVFF